MVTPRKPLFFCMVINGVPFSSPLPLYTCIMLPPPTGVVLLSIAPFSSTPDGIFRLPLNR